MKSDLSKKYLNNLFEYIDGSLYWRVVKSYRIKAGDKAGRRDVYGYVKIMIDRKLYCAHRIIWVMHNGPISTGMQIDHIDMDKGNNRINNLRLATRSQNYCNKSKNKNNTSGFKGVSFHKGINKYVAQIRVDGKNRHIGIYRTPELAAAAYQKQAILHHKEFARV